MNRRTLLAAAAITSIGLGTAAPTSAQTMDTTSQATFDTVMSFMDAMGSGDMEKMSSLMADDMVWQNEGDNAMPWIGPWEGKEEIFKFLPIFGKNFKTTKWETEDAIASGETFAAFGSMNGVTTATGQDIGNFTFGLRAKVNEGQIVLWNWLENSYAVSNAFHGKGPNDEVRVQVFYDFLSNPGSESHAAAFKGATADGWESIGGYSGKNKSTDAFIGQLGGFAKLIPDLSWAVQDMHQDGNVITVRSRATGTPVGPLFGVDGKGRSFDILTIDVHHIKNGKIATTYHVEDWAGALQQLSGR